MTLRSASFAAGLSLAAAFVLALPLSVQAGAAHCNCGSRAHSSAGAHAAVRTSATVRVSASAYGHTGSRNMAGWGNMAHGGNGYGRPSHYPSHVMHYPTRYPDQPEGRTEGNGGYAYSNGSGDRRDDSGHDHYLRGYNGGNSYALTYAPSYDDDGYAGGDYASAPAADYASQGYGQDDSGDYASAPQYDQGSYDQGGDSQGYAYNDAPAYNDAQSYDNYADTRYSSDTRYSDATYATMSYDDAAYASPPPPAATYAYNDTYAAAPPPQVQGWRDTGGGWHCGCGAPVDSHAVTAYGWRDQYGEWHVTSETRQSSYSYSYSSR